MKLKTVERGLLPLGVAIGVVLAERLSSWLEAWLSKPGAVVLFSIVVISVGIELIRFVAETLFDHSRLLRRLLLGDQYLEGAWFDIMRVNGRPSEVGISYFRYDDWEIKYTGEDYDLKCDGDCPDLAMAHQFPFTAETIVYAKDNKLLYKYTAARSDRDDVEVAGYGELQFHPNISGIPTRYSGHYYRPEGEGNFRKVCFQGFRLDDRKDRECLQRLENPGTKRDTMRQLLKRFEAAN